MYLMFVVHPLSLEWLGTQAVASLLRSYLKTVNGCYRT
jgi:hypothetical protein